MPLGREKSLRNRRILVSAVFALMSVGGGLFVTIASVAAGELFAWHKADPESQGFSAAKLHAMAQQLARQRTEALVVIRNDRIVLEWYAPGFGRHVRHYTASLAKAIVGGMALAVAIDDGRIAPDDLACKYVPEWRSHRQKSRITIRHLATHSSGLEDAREGNKPHSALTGWKGEFWRRKKNPFIIARDQVPLLFEPGRGFQYSNTGMAMLGYCMAAALQGAPEPDIRTLLTRRIMDPIGARREDWSMSYGRSWKVDGLTVHAVWGGGAYTPDAVIRIGRLMLRKGDWQGRQLISTRTVELVTADAGMPTPDRSEGPVPRCGLCWWVNSDGVFARLPRDAYFGAGAGHQILAVVPRLNLILLRMGQKMSGDSFWGAVERFLINPLMDALQDAHPLPRSHLIQGIRFAPRHRTIRLAVGSDNWPMTWGDDDAVYAAYGDGWGFEPRVGRKLSLGFARIVGDPPHVRGMNIRSASGERTGDGPKGPKASGMLMVRGVLYMWVRNVGNSQLAWSTDHGRTWQWGFRFTESFGCPTFLNFGRNYALARDNYVYTYSPDGPSAYQSSDGVVLARVPLERITDRGSYEFFAGTDAHGQPRWTSDISRRVPVLRYPGHCGRLDVVYNAGLGRYLMAMGHNHKGGWGIYEAPEPWGPWAVAFETPRWDCGDTHSYRIPTKWINADGRHIYIVFSGRRHKGVDYDAFCVRAATIELYHR